MNLILFKPDPELDLVLERVVDVPREMVWAAWTTPEQILQWFTPDPWKTIDCRLDLRPGGEFYTMMQSPEGEKFPNNGCFLEIVPSERLVFTDTMGPGYRPSANPFMTAAVILESLGTDRTKYTAIAIHGDEETRKKHIDMGFTDGWSKALDQLVALVKKNMKK